MNKNNVIQHCFFKLGYSVNILLNVYLKYKKKSLFKSRFLAMFGKKNSNIRFLSL